jgi:hypothetical protein
VHQVLRLHHDSMHTERSSVEWLVRFVRFHLPAGRQAACGRAKTSSPPNPRSSCS